MNEDKKLITDNLVRKYCKENDVSHLDLLVISLMINKLTLEHIMKSPLDMEDFIIMASSDYPESIREGLKSYIEGALEAIVDIISEMSGGLKGNF
jgi:hypothetical protein